MIGLRMKMEELTYNCDKQQAESAIQTLEIMDSTIEEIRRISNDLMPSVLREFGINNAVRDLCEEVLTKSKINTDFSSSGDLGSLDRKQNLYVFRIIQEAVTNIIKHSEATNVNISIEVSGEFLSVVIADNGKGFNFDGLTYDCHQGILNMKERAQLLGGTFGVESSAGKGTTINIRIPLNS
jgi:signal transduction histidine kinase